MQSSGVVLLLQDATLAKSLFVSLRKSFRPLQAGNIEELRTILPHPGVDIAVLDLEMISLAEIARLGREFPNVRIICTHRLADEEMWMAALNAGAADFCPAADVRAILTAALRSPTPARSAAA